MSLYNVLPQPTHSYTTTNHSHANTTPQIDHLQVEIARLNANIPPYGQRQGYIPREPEDFGDGGAFPEILIKQYPLDMGRKDLNKLTSSVVPLKVNDKGEVQYDAILRENMRKDQILHSKYEDLIPKDDIDEDDLQKPTEDVMMEETDETRKALSKLINHQIESVRPTHTNLKSSKPVTVRYQSGTQASNPSHASGATSRLIKIYDMPTDPLDPPKFKHKKLPVRPPSPPVPIMHSPPRQVTVEDQKNWKIPPCVSNWKNNKGFTLPLHQRLAADGRGLYNHVINDKFAKFSEALLIAERQARKEVEARAQMKLKLSKKQKEQKEKELAQMAKTAKESAKYNSFVGVDNGNGNANGNADGNEKDKRTDRDRDTSEYDAHARKRHRDNNNNRHRDNNNNRHRDRHRHRHSENESDSDSESSSSDDDDDDERNKAYEEREKIRKDRERERKRQYRLDKKKTGKNNSVRQRERDISERIALGQVSGKKSTQSLYDNRLFNQNSGLNTGFAADDQYSLYDRPLFQGKRRKMYRPSAMDDEVYGIDGGGTGDVLNEKSDKIRPHKGFDGAEENRGNKRGRFEFEKDESASDSDDEVEVEQVNNKDNDKDELMDELNKYSSVREKRRTSGGGGHHKGYMYAAAGGGSIRNVEDYVPGNRDKVAFEVAKDADHVNNSRDNGRGSGLYYTDDMRKEKERRDRIDRERYNHGNNRGDRRQYDRYDRKRRSRSRSRSRSDSRDRDNGRYHRNGHRDRDRNKDRDRRKRDSDEHESRGRWGH